MASRHFRAAKRLNPFPGRQMVRLRRKLLSEPKRKSKLDDQDFSWLQAVVGGTQLYAKSRMVPHNVEHRVQNLSPIGSELEEDEEEYFSSTEVRTEGGNVSSSEYQTEEGDLCPHEEQTENGNLTPYGEETEAGEQVLPGYVQNFGGVTAYFDEATGLIEIEGVPKPEAAPLDHIISVREQVEAMLAEWEAYKTTSDGFAS